MKESDGGYSPFAVLKEKILTDYMGFAVDKHTVVYGAINQLAVRLVESGVSQVMVDQYRVRTTNADGGPKVLTLEHLGAGFYIWLASVAIATFIFVLELSAQKILKRWPLL